MTTGLPAGKMGGRYLGEHTMSEDDAERMLRTMQVAAATLDAAGVERLETENEELRAIVADLADCDPSDPDLGDCTLCSSPYHTEHVAWCPYQRALDFMGGVQ